MTRGKRSWVWVVAVCSLVGAVIVGRQALLEAWADWLDVGETPRKSDYVLVLSGGQHTRPFGGAALVEAGMADHVLLTHDPPPACAEGGVALEDISKRALAVAGVSDDQVTVLEGAVDSTRDEAAALARFLTAHPGSTVTVLTNSYHSRRTRFIFERTLPHVEFERLQFVTVPTDAFDATNWWRSQEGFAAYAGESTKLIAYRFLYGNAFAFSWLALALASVGVASWWFWRRQKTRAERVRRSANSRAPRAPRTED